MSMIRPVDMQLLVQKSAEASRLHDGAARQEHGNAQLFSDMMKKEVKESDHHVQNTNKSEQQNVDKDGKGHSEYKRREEEKKHRRDKEEKPVKKSASMFDVSI